MKAQSGLAVVMVLVVLLLVEAMAAGMLALATHTRAAAHTQLRTTRAEAAAYLAARQAINRWDSIRVDTLPAGSTTPLSSANGSESDASWSATLERLQSQFLIRSEARVGGVVLYSRAGTITVARTLDRRMLLDELDAAIKSRAAVVLAGSSMVRSADSACSTIPPRLPAAIIATGPPMVVPTAVIDGVVVVDSSLAWPDSAALGNASWSEVAAIADRVETGVVIPLPALSNASCDTLASANWGDPSQAVSACAGYFPLIFSPGDLTMAGGRGQGILAIAGTFTMTGNAVFSGAVIARDGIALATGSQINGAALSRAGYVLVQDAMLTHSFCELQQAVAATRAFRRLIPQTRRFLPVF